MPTQTPPVDVEAWIAEARKSGGKVLPVRRFVGDVAGEAQADGLVPCIMSTSGEDRAGDTVSDDGWDLSAYLRNPVLLWSHDQSIPAIGNMVDLQTGPLRGKMKFTPREVNPFGDMVGGLYRHGFLKAGSVGFMPTEWDFTDHGVRFKKQVLLEHSCCNVPMNADALASAKSLGIDVGLFLPFAEKALDGDKAAPFWLPQKQAFAIYRSLGARPVQVPISRAYDGKVGEVVTITVPAHMAGHRTGTIKSINQGPAYEVDFGDGLGHKWYVADELRKATDDEKPSMDDMEMSSPHIRQSELAAQVERMAGVVDGLAAQVAALKAAPVVEAKPAPAAKPAANALTPEKAAEATARILSKKLAELTGRAPQD